MTLPLESSAAGEGRVDGMVVTGSGQIVWSVRDLLSSPERRKAAAAMRVVKLNTNPTMQDALGVLDTLRKEVESGQVVAFFVAGVGPNDEAIAYTSAVRNVTRLRLQGAMAQALHNFMQGEV